MRFAACPSSPLWSVRTPLSVLLAFAALPWGLRGTPAAPACGVVACGVTFADAPVRLPSNEAICDESVSTAADVDAAFGCACGAAASRPFVDAFTRIQHFRPLARS